MRTRTQKYWNLERHKIRIDEQQRKIFAQHTGRSLRRTFSFSPIVQPSLPLRHIFFLVQISERNNNNNYNTMPANNTTGPELRGANITLDTILKPTDASLRQTKIICTLGPACWDVPTLEALIEAGLSVARFNFSHGDHKGHQECLDRLRIAVKNTNKYVGMCSMRLFFVHS